MTGKYFHPSKKKDPRPRTISANDSAYLLSIDVDAHLQKIAANTYRSAAHYPVELVRCAIKRGANYIQIEINKKKIEIKDNGPGINQLQLEKLYTLMEPYQTFEKREQSILDLQNHQGIGLLAIFSPSPTKIFIKNIFDSQKVHILFQHGKFHKSNPPASSSAYPGSASGTHIILSRKTENSELEKLILQKYCQYAESKIILNGQLISQKTFLKNSLVFIKIREKKNHLKGQIGIPKYGDVCRIWLLDQGILLTRKTFAPWKGFIFEVAAEYSGEINGLFLSSFLDDIHQLYLYMLNHYNKFPVKYQPRIEELLFKHHRLTNDPHLVNLFSPFRSSDLSSFFSLSQLQKKARMRTLYAISPKSKNSIFSISNRDVLILNPVQIDYLINFVRIPLQLLHPIFHKAHPVNRVKYFLFKVIKNVLIKNKLKKNKIIPLVMLSDKEKIFIKELSLYVSKKINPESNSHSLPVMIKSKGILPTLITREKQCNRDLIPAQIILRQNHPLVKRAVHMVFINRENIEWIAPLFIE